MAKAPLKSMPESRNIFVEFQGYRSLDASFNKFCRSYDFLPLLRDSSVRSCFLFVEVTSELLTIACKTIRAVGLSI